VPLDPAYKAGLAGHVPVKVQNPKAKSISNVKGAYFFVYRLVIWISFEL
jgi:hypothetical protein